MAYDYDINFNLKDCIETLGLNERGKVQRFVTQEFKKNVQDYVPLDIAEKYENPGRLIDSCRIEDDTDVVWDTPYARNLYYNPDYNFQGAPTRGAYWADRYLQDGGLKELEDGARRIARK